MKTVIVNSRVLGTNCWSTRRFCGGRCDRVMVCNYPEKKTCKAVASEVEFIKQTYRLNTEKAKKALEQLEQHEAIHSQFCEIGHSILGGKEITWE